MWNAPFRIVGWRARALLALALGLAVTLLQPYPAARLDPKDVVSTRIVDRHGNLLYEARSARGGYTRWVSLEDVSPALVAATLSAEDAHFRWHPGVDPAGVTRALWLNAREGRFAYGGSTVTQQLAKLLAPEPRTLSGKLREARDAFRLELSLSKDEILEQYLNRAYYGRQAYGVQAAAERFFGKSANQLELDEAALLAILPRGPTAYDPARFPERAQRRRARVLTRLADRGWLDAEAARRAAARPIQLVAPRSAPKARHVLDTITPQERWGEPQLRTTVDLGLQQQLEVRLQEHLRALVGKNADQAAIVVIENVSGEVLAMVGSRDYTESEVLGANNGALALRPPGSTLKPFVYALALEQGAHPSSPVFDVPTSWPDFQPRNLEQRHLGLVTLRDALGSSLNIPAVRSADAIGIHRVAALLGELGLGAAAAASADLSLALGGAPVRLVDLSNAYATLARGGAHLPWHVLESDRAPAGARRVLDPAAAYLVTSVLADAGARRRQFGVETPLELPFPAAVKTGTSKSFCDNVVVGYTPELTVGVWVGNFDGRPMQGVLAMHGAAPLWRDAMLLAMAGRERRDFAAPASVTRTEVCPLSGMRRGQHCPSGQLESVARAHAPSAACDWHQPEGELAVPAELAQLGRPGLSTLGTPGLTIEIRSPLPNAAMTIDPLLPRSRQALELRALVRSSHATHVRWALDGRALGDVARPFATHWPIVPGRHRLRATALAHGRELGSHEVQFDVKGERHDL